MAPIHLIISMMVIQIIGNILLEKNNLSKWKYLVLASLITLNIFILPSYFIPRHPENKPVCGMPAMGVTLGFWIIGNGATLITHLVSRVFYKYCVSKLSARK